MHGVDRRFEARGPARHGTQQGPRLHAHERRPDAVPRGVGDRHRQAATLERQEVEEVAPRLVGWAVPAGDVESGHARVLPRQEALLDRAGDPEVAFDPLLLGEVVEKPLPLDRHPRLAPQKAGDLLVAVVERAGPLVEQLQHADRGVVVAREADGEHAPRAKAAGAVELGIEAVVGVGVGEVLEPAGPGHVARDAAARRKPDLGDRRVGDPGRDPAAELVGVLVVEKHRRPLAVEQGRGGIHDRRQHGVEVDGGPEPAGHGEEPLEVGDPAGGGRSRRGHEALGAAVNRRSR